MEDKEVVMMNCMNKTYLELSLLTTFEERFEYLQLKGRVGESTFGSKRHLNQVLYRSKEWIKLRDKIILRDNGCDLGIAGREIIGKVLIHHINPITIEDVINRNSKVFDMNNLITVSHMTHEAIHYGDESLLIKDPIVRTKNDTCPWKNV